VIDLPCIGIAHQTNNALLVTCLCLIVKHAIIDIIVKIARVIFLTITLVPDRAKNATQFYLIVKLVLHSIIV
jgi:hypothetical protein